MADFFEPVPVKLPAMKMKVPRCFETSKTTGPKTHRHNRRLEYLIPSSVYLLLDIARILSQKQEFKIIYFHTVRYVKISTL
jgi:hypothetical protein